MIVVLVATCYMIMLVLGKQHVSEDTSLEKYVRNNGETSNNENFQKTKNGHIQT